MSTHFWKGSYFVPTSQIKWKCILPQWVCCAPFDFRLLSLKSNTIIYLPQYPGYRYQNLLRVFTYWLVMKVKHPVLMRREQRIIPHKDIALISNFFLLYQLQDMIKATGASHYPSVYFAQVVQHFTLVSGALGEGRELFLGICYIGLCL